MIYSMKLFKEPFEQIKNGSKRIEVRLQDEKRKSIQTGDHIIFLKLPEQTEQIETIVTALYPCESFFELYSLFPSEEFGFYKKSMEDMIERTREIYPEEKEKQFGVLGIGIEKLV